MKKCIKCLKVLKLNKFHKSNQTQDGRYSWCRYCKNDKDRDHYIKNKDKINENKRDKYDSSKKKQYYEKNKVKIKSRTAAYKKNRYRTNTEFKIYEILSSGLRRLLKGKAKKNKALQYLGCTVDEFKIHIESQFTEGMTWDNWSMRGWHLDHRIPISSFNLLNEADVHIACHYTNFQPLWAVDNLKKGAKLPS